MQTAGAADTAAADTCYAVDRARVAVCTDAASTREWLDAFLSPGFELVEPADGDPVVTVTCDPAAVDSLRGRRDELGLVPCFALDRSVVHHPASRTERGEVIVEDHQYGTRYVLGPVGVTVVRVDPAPRSRAGVMRVVRELVTTRAVSDGHLQLHAGAVARDGDVVVFAGPKEAGKTTLVARLASMGDGAGRLAIAGNDRLLLAAPDGASTTWTARQVSTIVSIRPGTRELLPALARAFPAVPSPAHLTDAELAVATVTPDPGSRVNRVKVSPTQFAAALGAPLATGGRVARVLLLSVDPAVDGYQLRDLSVTEARGRLDTARYGNRPAGTPRTVFEVRLGIEAPPDGQASLLDALAAQVPVAELRMGPRLVHDDQLAAELVTEVFSRA